MTEETLPAQEVGQTSEQSIQHEPGTQQAEPVNVTVDALEKIANRLERYMQSLSDKQESRIKKELQDRFSEIDEMAKEMRAAGLDPDKAVSVAKEQAMTELLASTRKAAQPQAQPQSDPNLERIREETQLKAMKISAKYEVMLSPNDPEARDVNVNASTPEAYLESLEAAVVRKAKRLGKELPQEAPQYDAAARVGVQGRGSAPTGTIEALTRKVEALQRDPVRNWSELQKATKELEALLRR